MKDPELMQRHDGELDDVTPAPESIDPVSRAKADALVSANAAARRPNRTRFFISLAPDLKRTLSAFAREV